MFTVSPGLLWSPADTLVGFDERGSHKNPEHIEGWFAGEGGYGLCETGPGRADHSEGSRSEYEVLQWPKCCSGSPIYATGGKPRVHAHSVVQRDDALWSSCPELADEVLVVAHHHPHRWAGPISKSAGHGACIVLQPFPDRWVLRPPIRNICRAQNLFQKPRIVQCIAASPNAQMRVELAELRQHNSFQGVSARDKRLQGIFPPTRVQCVSAFRPHVQGQDRRRKGRNSSTLQPLVRCAEASSSTGGGAEVRG
mmetsp:Transcript_13469/g.39207  ORF Transcript_13469/g.39207 Transcript_13469/m.39207 type:complete len:253 (-) Transcript_13469:447-1205(-)